MHAELVDVAHDTKPRPVRLSIAEGRIAASATTPTTRSTPLYLQLDHLVQIDRAPDGALTLLLREDHNELNVYTLHFDNRRHAEEAFTQVLTEYTRSTGTRFPAEDIVTDRRR